MLGIDAKETVQFVSKEDTGEVKTVFTIGTFTNLDKMKIGIGSMDSTGKFDTSKFQDKIFDILKAGVRKIENLGGKTYEFPNGMNEEILELIPFTVLTELFQKVMEVNFPSAAETKN